jgi:hypothetical protein
MALQTNVVYVVRGADQPTKLDDGLVYTPDEIEKAIEVARVLSRKGAQHVVVPVMLGEEGRVVFRFEDGNLVPPASG